MLKTPRTFKLGDRSLTAGGPFTCLLPALLALWTLCACSPPGQGLPPLAPDAVVLAFGDSLTAGAGVSSEQAYPAQLAKLIGRRVINAGRNGELSAEGLARLPGLLDQYHPQLLLLCHGGNDLLRHRSKSRLAANLTGMIDAARKRGIAVVLIGVPAPALFGLESEPLYTNVAVTEGVPIEDEVLPGLEADRSMKSDQIHLNAAGYGALAEAISRLLHQRGAL